MKVKVSEFDDTLFSERQKQFIVLAVNNHEMLLQALKHAAEIITECIPDDDAFPEFARIKKSLKEVLMVAEEIQ